MSTTVTDKSITTDITLRAANELPHLPHAAAIRKDALETLRALGLPASKNEEYKYTPITRVLERNFNFTTPNTPGAANAAAFAIPGLGDANVLVFVNGAYDAAQSRIVSPASELTVLPLAEAFTHKSAIVAEHFAKHADHNADAFAAWNTATWQQGVFIEVPANQTIEKPVVIYHIHDTQNGQVVSMHRNLFVVGRSAAVTIVEKLDTTGAGNGFSNHVTEAVVSENAGLDLYLIQDDHGNRYHAGHTHVYQGNSSRVNTYTYTLDGKFVRNNLRLSLDGEGIESHMYGLYLLQGETLADNHTVADHKKPNSFSNEIYKGVLDGKAKGVFNGKIYVRPQAQKTNAFQANRNILLTDSATINTKPQLEIWADDVKCSHGCTTGQLDEEALFYLRARGIPKDTARAMMLYAFAGELLDAVKNPVIREFLDGRVSDRLHKNF
jgi:Fe-S cluster assembly protein SufD